MILGRSGRALDFPLMTVWIFGCREDLKEITESYLVRGPAINSRSDNTKGTRIILHFCLFSVLF